MKQQMFGSARSKNDVVPKKLAIIQLVGRPLTLCDCLQDALTSRRYVSSEMVERKAAGDYREMFRGPLINFDRSALES